MEARKNRWRRPVIGVGLVLVVVALFLPAIGGNERDQSESVFCTRCGLLKFSTQTVTNEEPARILESHEELIPTQLSRWHVAHYSDPCNHIWRYNHSSSCAYLHFGPIRFRAHSAEAGSSVTPRLISLDSESRDHLDELFQRDPAACQEYIELQLKPRS